MDKKIITILTKDDITNFILLYRKLASTNFDVIGVHTAYDRKDQKFVLNNDLVKCFPGIAYLGPTPLYECFVTYSNYPTTIDFNNYKGNSINIDLMTHLKTHHLNDIYPNHKTIYHPRFLINKEEFEKARSNINQQNLNICVNMFDPCYDAHMELEYDISFCITELIEKYKGMKVNINIVGLLHEIYAAQLQSKLEETFDLFTDVTLTNYAACTFSEQVSVLMHSDLLISGAYGIGYLAYSLCVPTFMIYSFEKVDLMGKTIAREKDLILEKPNTFIETTDSTVFDDVPKAIELIEQKRATNSKNWQLNQAGDGVLIGKVKLSNDELKSFRDLSWLE